MIIVNDTTFDFGQSVPRKRSVVTIGAYDGVHRGHQAVIEQVRQQAEILNAQPKLKEVYEARKRLDLKFANDEWEQLYFIYQNSPYFEPSFMRLPVYEVY